MPLIPMVDSNAVTHYLQFSLQDIVGRWRINPITDFVYVKHLHMLHYEFNKLINIAHQIEVKKNGSQKLL